MPTWNLTSFASASTVHSAVTLSFSHVDLSTNLGAGATTNSIAVSSNAAAGSAGGLVHFVSSSPSVNNASWPSGKYTATIEIGGAGASISYGLVSLSSGNGHFGRINGSTDLESTTQANAAFTGTGVKVSSRTWTPSAGATTDLWELHYAVQNVATMASSISWRYQTSSHTAVMPSSAAGATPPPHTLALKGVGR